MTQDNERREAVARLQRIADGEKLNTVYVLPKRALDPLRADIIAILSLPPPAGWKLVPVEPTREMLAAANKASLSTAVLMDDTRFACEAAGYRAMLSVSPRVGGDRS